MASNGAQAWDNVTLQKLVRQRREQTLPELQDSRPYVALEHIQGNFGGLLGHGLAEEATSNKFTFSKGDILFGKLRPNLKKCVVAPFDGVCSTDILVLEARDSVDKHLLLHILRSDEVVNHAISTATGTRMPRTSWDSLSQLAIKLPPRHLQGHIARHLDAIDEAIEATRAVIDQTRRLKTALLQDLLTNGLRKGAHKKDTLKGIGKVPSHWHLRTVGQLIASGHILEVQDGNHGNDHPKESDFVVAGIPFVAANCIRDGKLYPAMFKFITEDQASSLRIGHARQGDLILTHKGSVGLTAYVDPPFDRMVLTPQTTYYRVDQSKLVRAYLRAYFEDERFQSHLHRLASQSTRDYVGITEQKKLTIPVPPFEEQQLIGTTRDELESKVSSEAECLNTLLLVKSALSQGLLTGRIPVKGAE